MRHFKVICCILLFAFINPQATVWAIHWPDNMSYRVESMGGVTLAIEDESTDLNLFNYENTAGMAFLPKKNRIDAGLTYKYMKTLIEDYRWYGFYYSLNEETECGLQRPGTEYQGLMVWLAENIVSEWRVGIVGTQCDGYNANYSRGTAGLSLAGTIGEQFAIGGEFQRSRRWLNDPANEDNALWKMAVAFKKKSMFGKDDQISAGFLIGSDDNFEGDPNDYSAVFSEIETSISIVRMSGQVFWETPEVIKVGVVIDNKHQLHKEVYEYGVERYRLDSRQWGVSPIIKLKIKMNEHYYCLVGAQYSNWGTGSMEEDIFQPGMYFYKSQHRAESVRHHASMAIGILAEEIAKVALQVDKNLSEDEYFQHISAYLEGSGGEYYYEGDPYTERIAIRGGLEVSPFDILDIRLGIVSSSYEYFKENASYHMRYTIGLGLNTETATKFDLLFGYESEDPEKVFDVKIGVHAVW